MTPKKYMSEKKTTTQTISISPALKDWIERFVKTKNKEFPEDDCFKSVSAFYCDIMEKSLELFEKGKSFEDFNQLIGNKINLIWKDMETNVLIPRYNSSVETHRYTGFDINDLIRYYITIRNYYLENLDKNKDIYRELRKQFNQIKEKIHSQSITEYLNLDFIKDKNNDARGVFEFKGKQRNIHYEACKSDALAIGMLGGKIKDCLYSDRDNYLRFDLAPTELMFTDELRLKERKKLMQENLNFLINYSRIIKDEDYYLWMSLAKDNDVLIHFKNQNTFNRWIKKIEKDILKYENKNAFLECILKFFERIHWIRIIDEDSFSFKSDLPEESKLNFEFMINYLSNYSEIIETQGEFRLERIGKFQHLVY